MCGRKLTPHYVFSLRIKNALRLNSWLRFRSGGAIEDVMARDLANFNFPMKTFLQSHHSRMSLARDNSTSINLLERFLKYKYRLKYE